MIGYGKPTDGATRTRVRPESPRPSKLDSTLGTALQRIRLEHGMTQENLAFDSNVTIATLSRIERGVSDPSWGHVRARGLGITLRELSTAIEYHAANEGGDA